MKKLFLILTLLPYFLLAQNVNQTIRADKVKVSAPSGRQSVTESDKFNAIVDMNTPSLVAPSITTTGIKRQGDLSDKISFTNLITYGNLPASGGEWNWGNATFSMARLNWSGLRLGYIEASPNLSPSATLDVFGTVRIRNNAANGRFFRSDASGYGTWQDVSFLSPSGGTMTGTLDVPRLRFTGNSILIGSNGQAWNSITGISNILVGSASSITNGQQNIIIGYGAAAFHTTGSRNTIIGNDAKLYTNSGDDNTIIGYQAGTVTGGNSNILLGRGTNATNGSFNVVIGNNASVTNRNRHILLADGAGTERIRVDSVGNVGIANNAPTQRLTVSGNVLSNGFILSGGTSSQFLKANGTTDNNSYATITNLNTRIHKDSLTLGSQLTALNTWGDSRFGRLGSSNTWVGTNSFGNISANDISVLGNLTLPVGIANISGDANFFGNVKISNGTQGTGKLLQSDATGNATWWTPNYGALGSSNNWTAANTYTGGITSNQLAINGTAGAGFVSFVPQSSSPSTPVSGFRQFATSAGLFAWRGSNGFDRIFDASTITANRTWSMKDASGTVPLESTVNTYSANQIFNGSVGIGASPSSRLDVAAGSTQFEMPLTIRNSTHATSRRTGIALGTTGAAFQMGVDLNVNGTNDFFVYDGINGSNRLIINNNGNIGIGTVLPTSRLDINGSQSNNIRIVSSNTTLGEDRFIIITASATITLPAASSCTKRTYTINARAASVTISSYNDLSGSAQTTIANGTSITIISDGANWQRVQ